MYTFEDIRSMSGNVLRSKSTQKRYVAIRRVILAKYSSYEDYVKIKYMGFAPVAFPGSKITAIKDDGVKTFYIGKNRFPYDVKRGIRHWVLFSLRALSVKAQKKIIESSIPKNAEYVFYMNAKETQSMPKLWHVQIFWKST